MDEDKKLYPFRFAPITDEYSWGSETFELADLGYRDSSVRGGWLAGNDFSEIMDMYLDRVVGEPAFSWWGRQFPICVRRIKVKAGEAMPLRVHPGDETAQDRYDFLGKEKVWYISSAGKDAKIYLGFKKDCDAAELFAAISDASSKKVESLLNVVAPHAGQVIPIHPGCVHAAAGNMEIIEVSESSPMDFCLYGWGKEVSEDEFDPSLSSVEALDFIDYRKYTSDAPSLKGDVIETLHNIPQFKLSRISLADPVRMESGENGSFTALTCERGEAVVRCDQDGNDSDTPLKKGETVLVPQECEVFSVIPMAKDTVILETHVEPHPDSDPYINPNVSASLDD